MNFYERILHYSLILQLFRKETRSFLLFRVAATVLIQPVCIFTSFSASAETIEYNYVKIVGTDTLKPDNREENVSFSKDLSINDKGTVAFLAQQGPITPFHYITTGNGEQTVVRYVSGPRMNLLTDIPVPGTPSINNDETISLGGTLFFNEPTQLDIVLTGKVGRAHTLLANTGNGTEAGTITSLINKTSIDESGAVAFFGGIGESFPLRWGIFLGTSPGECCLPSPSPIALQSSQAQPTPFEDFPDKFERVRPANSNGEVAFRVTLTEDSGGGEAIVSGNASRIPVLQNIILYDTKTPVDGFQFSNFGPPANASSGFVIAFRAQFVTGGQGIFLGSRQNESGGPITSVALDAVADPSSVFSEIGDPGVNDAGQIVFWGRLKASGIAGIFTGPKINADKVIIEGDTIHGSTIVSSIARQSMHEKLNNKGQIAFHATLSVGGATILRADPASDFQAQILVTRFINQLEGGTVLRYDGRAGALVGEFPDPVSCLPIDMEYGPDGKLYLLDIPAPGFGGCQTDWSVRRFNGRTGQFEQFVEEEEHANYIPILGAASNLTFGPDGNLYISDGFFDSRILRYQGPFGASPGEFMDEFVSLGRGDLFRAGDLVFGPDGNLYVLDSNSRVFRYEGPNGLKPGDFIDVFLPSGTGGLSVALDLAFDLNGNLCLADNHLVSILCYEGPSGSLPGTFIKAIEIPADRVRALSFGIDGNLYVTVTSAPGFDGVLRFDGQSGNFLGTFASVSNPGELLLSVIPEPVLGLGDFNEDGCVDTGDLSEVLTAIRSPNPDLKFDLNGDGVVNIADARKLVLLFKNHKGSTCT